VNTLNLVSNFQEAAPDPTKKKLLASIAITFADSPNQSVRSAFRWEASAGAFFSTLLSGPFLLPGFSPETRLRIRLSLKTSCIRPWFPSRRATIASQTTCHGAVWKSNLYWTGAVGINPNTVTADFATGLSCRGGRSL